jgi:2-C-methyl-D-erythritol 4-phosphate cytidylyltransferase
MNIAFLTAAGTGTRVGQDIPKQFLSIYDKPLIIYTLEKFQKHPEIDYICVVCLEGWESILKAYSKQFNISKLEWVFKGGDTGMQSIQNAVFGLQPYLKFNDIVLVQDGIRANTNSIIISDCIALTREKGNAITAIPIVEAPFYSEDMVISTKAFDRDHMMRTQTPHGITYGKLLEIHNKANSKEIKNTVATCTLMVELGYPIYFCKGSETNFKITTMDDIEMFKALLHSEKLSWEIKEDCNGSSN